MKTYVTRYIALALLSAPMVFGADFAFIDFGKLMQTSKLAQREQQSLAILAKELEGRVNALDSEIQKAVDQLKDPDYIDSLSQEAENEQRQRLQMLGEERMRTAQQVQAQFQQTQQRTVQSLQGLVAAAASQLASQKHYKAIFSKEVAFFVDADLDCTAEIVEMVDSTDAHPESKSGDLPN